MLDHARAARRILGLRPRPDLDTDEELQLALTRAVEVIGEAAARVSDATRAAWPQVAWKDIVGTRNRLIHGYDRVDLDVLWSILVNDLPLLVVELEKILTSESSA
ncbi:MAG: DUF86 domain-containing protein [Planctomycetota bacterium]|nr:DUF86 domain-containing protein [Planctomycetota bacterium]